MPRPMHGNANEFWSNSAKAGGGRGPSVYFRGAPVDAASPAESLLHYNLLYCICVHVLIYCICVFAQLYLCAQAAKLYEICIGGAAAATAAWWGFGRVFLLRGNLPLIRTLRSGFATLHPPSNPPLPSPTATCPFNSSSTSRPPWLTFPGQ